MVANQDGKTCFQLEKERIEVRRREGERTPRCVKYNIIAFSCIHYSSGKAVSAARKGGLDSERAPVGKSVVLHTCAQEGSAGIEACFKRFSEENDIVGLSSVKYAVIVWGGRGQHQDM